MGVVAASAIPDDPSASPPENLSPRPPLAAGAFYGSVLSYLDPETLGLWTGGPSLKGALFRWYVKLFGYPELAANRRFHQVEQALENSGSKLVLDLGAGSGLYSIADGIRRPESTHILADLSGRHIHRACVTSRSMGVTARGVVCRAEAVPLAPESLDAILVLEVLQFVDDDARAVSEVGRLLRTGGVWVCEQERVVDNAPHGGSLSSGKTENRLTKRRAGYSAGRLSDLAQGAGLTLESTQVISGRVSRWWEGLEARILGRSRAAHLLLFPLMSLVARITALLPSEEYPGTVLYVFRKHHPVPSR